MLIEKWLFRPVLHYLLQRPWKYTSDEQARLIRVRFSESRIASESVKSALLLPFNYSGTRKFMAQNANRITTNNSKIFCGNGLRLALWDQIHWPCKTEQLA